MNTANPRRNFLIVLFAAASMAMLSSCAGVGMVGSKYMNERTFEVPHAIDMPQATELAAQAFLSIERTTLGQKNTATGFVAGKRMVGWWVNTQSFFYEIYITTPGERSVKVHITTIAGPEVAFTDELDDLAEDFYNAYEVQLNSHRP